MKLWQVCVVGAFLFQVVTSGSAMAYTEIEVKSGGSIKGQVTIQGEKPRPMAFNLVTIPDPVYCGRISTGTGWRIVEDFLIGPNQELKDVVVMLREIEAGKPFNVPNVKIEAKDCDFFPFVNVLRAEDEVKVINMDPIEHDIQGYETARRRGARVLFNRPLPMNPFHKVIGMFKKQSHMHLPGEPMIEKVQLKKGRNIFVMQCGFHPYMFSWGVVVKNPYYAITAENGRFEIGNVPPGDYTLSAWHPGMKAYLQQTITVPANGATGANFEYKAPVGRRSVHEMVENPHFGLELLRDGQVITPSLRLQKP